MDIRIECSNCNSPLEAKIDFYGVIKVDPCEYCQVTADKLAELEEELSEMSAGYAHDHRELSRDIEDGEQRIQQLECRLRDAEFENARQAKLLDEMSF